MINVTKSFLPPIEDYIQLIQKIWESNQLTNNGSLVKTLEEELKKRFGVKHMFFVTNGTIALQIAVKALGLTGEIITTPFSYVATTSSIMWEGCKPVFVDIDPETLCIDPQNIEPVLSHQTIAILPTHVFGIPCEVDGIKTIAQKHNLKVVYDASHAFGVKYHGKELPAFGDIAVLSFHATKIFHTAEGGALLTDNDEIAHTIRYMRNFGHKGKEDFWGVGINGKNSEFHAAMGLSILPYIDSIIDQRRQVSQWYDAYLHWTRLTKPKIPESTSYNYAYYPVLFEEESILLAVLMALNGQEIYPRRYFYPSLSQLPYVENQPMPVSEDISRRILCLPLYISLSEAEVEQIAEIINGNI